jgi:hypothetical protein
MDALRKDSTSILLHSCENRAAKFMAEFCGRIVFWTSSTGKNNKDIKTFNWVLNNLTRNLELFH